MKAILRTWVDETHSDQEIELNEKYDFSKGPYHPDNENFCPVVGSNQEIVIVDQINSK